MEFMIDENLVVEKQMEWRGKRNRDEMERNRYGEGGLSCLHFPKKNEIFLVFYCVFLYLLSELGPLLPPAAAAVVVDEDEDDEAKGDPQNMFLRVKSRASRLKLDWQQRLSIVNGVARGLMYLDEDSRLGRIIHRDIKASNILLDAEVNSKISDFGTVGTYGYMAPEYVMNVKDDVYSYGFLLLEIVSRKKNKISKRKPTKLQSTINTNRLLGCLVGSDKSCPREAAANHEHGKCQACKWTEALMKRLYAEAKSSLKISDFKRLDDEYKKSGGGGGGGGGDSGVPSYLDYVAQGIGRDITARAILSDDILVLPCALFYAVIDEMHNMKLKNINDDEDVILKWGAVIRDAKKMGLDVKFAEEHLKKIAHAYFQFKGGPASCEEKEEVAELDCGDHIICPIAEAKWFDDGAPLSKGILFPPKDEASKA